MFVIPCKNNGAFNFASQLVDDIRKFHSDPIVVVDSESENKSYFDLFKNHKDVYVEDINNKHWMIGAYWHAFKKYPNEDFYFFMHDSMRVKGNLDEIKTRDLTIHSTFKRLASPSFNAWQGRAQNETGYKYPTQDGQGVCGPIFFCKRWVMANMLAKKADVLLPSTKAETGFMEGAMGALLEEEGFNLEACSMYGDILQLESPGGRSGPYPHNTSWQFPIEKFYASHVDPNRR